MISLDLLNEQIEDAERELSDPAALLTTQERADMEAAVKRGNETFVELVAAEGGLPLFMQMLAAEIARDTPNHVPKDWLQ